MFLRKVLVPFDTQSRESFVTKYLGLIWVRWYWWSNMWFKKTFQRGR